MRKINLFFKRLGDIFVSGIMILVLLPLFVILAVLIKLTSKGRVVFTQTRIGKNNKPFVIYKFRTMITEQFDKDGKEIMSEKRITKMGKLLRKTSLDELPQLFNVFFGNMSIIGPRPMMDYQAPRCIGEEKLRFKMRPGLTGWAQVKGRNNIPWEERIQYDIEYVKKFNIWLDIVIIFKTILLVFNRQGTDVKPAYRGISRFSKYYIPEQNNNVNNQETGIEKKAKKALVLAGSWSQVMLINQLRERGIETVLADNNPNATAVKYADKFVKANILDVDVIKKIAIEEKVDFLITVCADQVLLTVAKVSEDLGLPCYIDYDTACKVSDKSYMKDIFSKNGIPTSKHVFMSKLDFEKLEGMEFPLVVKPVDAYSSKGVRKAMDKNELEQFFNEASEISRSGVVIVEEYVEGVELTCDYEVIDGKAQLLSVSNTEKVNYKDRFLAFRTRYPASVSEETVRRVANIGQMIATAFNLKDTPMLVQLLTDDKKESVLEFCARTGGGAKYLLIKAATGFDPIKAVIDLTLGNPVTTKGIKGVSKLVTNEFLYAYSGVFDHLEGFEELKQEGIIAEYWQFKWQGAEIKKAISSSDRIVSITIYSDTYEELVEKHNKIASRVKIIDIDGKDIMRHDLLTDIKPLYLN